MIQMQLNSNDNLVQAVNIAQPRQKSTRQLTTAHLWTEWPHCYQIVLEALRLQKH